MNADYEFEIGFQAALKRLREKWRCGELTPEDFRVPRRNMPRPGSIGACVSCKYRGSPVPHFESYQMCYLPFNGSDGYMIKTNGGCTAWRPENE